MKVLILGTSGFLGGALYKYLKTKKYSIFHTGLFKRKTDLVNINNLKKIILTSKPDLVINCCGLTNIDDCEKSKKLSKAINVDIIKNIFLIKKYYNLLFQFIHFSTDQIYNAKKNKRNKETETFKPANTYSLHKLKAEKICLKNSAIVFRTNLIGKSFSEKKSFTDWIYTNLKNNMEIYGFVDSHYSPLGVITVSKIIEKIILGNKWNKTGLYNLGSSDGISKFKLIETFSKKIGIFKKNLIKKEKINNICFTKRTKNNRLNVEKFKNQFKIKLPKISAEINKLVKFYE